MIELPAARFADLLPGLRALPINHLFARSVLERQVAGRVWVDDAGDPAVAWVAHPYGMSLLYGDCAPMPNPRCASAWQTRRAPVTNGCR